LKKERLDKVLVDLGYFETKSKASSAIMAGDVIVDEEKITKSGYQIDTTKEHNFSIKTFPFVSRGGLKLQKAFDTFDISAKDRICLDAGASTGGFTDCLLQHRAKFVYAADVGYGQLAWKIRNDKRVKTIEKTNLKICKFEDIYSENEPIADLLVSDLSFISLKKVIPNIIKLLNPAFHEMICLIKPQFEAGKELVEKGGVVKDLKVHETIVEDIIQFMKESGYGIKGFTRSPIKGPSGNIEYLIYVSTDKTDNDYSVKDIIYQDF